MQRLKRRRLEDEAKAKAKSSLLPLMGLLFALAVRRQWDQSTLACGDVKALALELLRDGGSAGPATKFCAERWTLGALGSRPYRAQDERTYQLVRGDSLLEYAALSDCIDTSDDVSSSCSSDSSGNKAEGDAPQAFYQFIKETAKVLQIAGTRPPAVRQMGME